MNEHYSPGVYMVLYIKRKPNST